MDNPEHYNGYDNLQKSHKQQKQQLKIELEKMKEKFNCCCK